MDPGPKLVAVDPNEIPPGGTEGGAVLTPNIENAALVDDKGNFHAG